MERKMNKKELLEHNKQSFLKKSKEKWGENYFDYSLMNYINQKTKIKLRCIKHNLIFEQTPDSNLRSCGCPECRKEKFHKTILDNRDNRNIIEEFKKVHGDKYDYSEVGLKESILNDNKVKIICPTHGPFYQNYNAHLKGCGCEKCAGRRYDGETEFISLAKIIYGDLYGYSNTKYIDSNTNILVTCNRHNIDFSVKPLNFLRPGHFTCPLCDTRVINTESFIERSKQLFGEDLYDFSETIYTKSKAPVNIRCCICGEIFSVLPDKFLREGIRCPCQRNVWKLESEIETFLKDLNKIYIKEYKFINLLSTKNFPLRFDFYIPDLNLIIECQGLQHFTSIDYFGRTEAYKNQLENDLIKYNYCKSNNIRVIYYTTKNNYYSYYNNYFSKDLYFDLDSIKQIIKDYEKTKLNSICS
jgi:hypothetical protein